MFLAARVLDDGKPLVLTLNRDPRTSEGVRPCKPSCGAHVVVENLNPIEDRAILCLERTHHTLSVAYLTVHALHSIIVVVSYQCDLSNVNRTVNVPIGSELLEPCVMI
jgi:hypothetical protein